jgi:GNAT superfamily N-acetyltransferase
VSKAPFRIALLNAEHDRSVFNSGSKPLDSYLKQQVTQDSRRRITACFVALDTANRIAGYYTLASASMLLSELPADIGKKLPRYPSVPAVRLGRLAVDHNFQGQGLGGALLADALDRAIRSEIAAYAMVVNAKDDRAAMFYHHHGFIILPTAKDDFVFATGVGAEVDSSSRAKGSTSAIPVSRSAPHCPWTYPEAHP